MFSKVHLRSPSAVLAVVLSLLQAQEPAGDVQKVTSPDGREVSYPTREAEVIAGSTTGRAIKPPFPVANGEAVVTKAALTHVRMRPGQPDAVFFQNTFVRFDATNRWLLRNGAAFIVNRRGKLAVVVEGLETLFVGSEVYVEVTDQGLLVYVLEGSVILGATASGITLGPSQAGRVARGGVPQRTVPTSGEQARIDRQIRLAKGLMGSGSTPTTNGGGGGAGKAIGVILGVGAVGAGVYLLTREKDPDLVPVAAPGGTLCEQQGRTMVVRVSNQGQGDAPASTTRVVLISDQIASRAVVGGVPQAAQADLPTGALAAGEVATLTLGTLCFGCRVQITADVTEQVKESNEGNNAIEGVCLGPG
jgi:CARDB protein